MVVGDGPVRPAGSTDEIEKFFRSRGVPAIVVAGSQDTVVVFPWGGRDTELVHLCNQLSAAVRQRFADDRVVIGVGALAAGSGALREPLIGSREVCQVLRRRHIDSRVGTFADVSTYRMLLGLHERSVLRRFADDILAPLRRHDEQSGTELERTLRVFLGHDAHWSTTAQDLYIHVNTLRNRVARIGELTGRDANRLDDRVDLFLALEADALAQG
jgi:DNA-binding PucR family transcriptional regulator